MTRASQTVGTLGELFDLDPVDDLRFMARNGAPHGVGRSLFGGQVAAQALRAAALTVAPSRRPHSLHGYFLRPGDPDQTVVLTVERERDGGSISTRHVRALQGSEVIFSMLTSFKDAEDTPAVDCAPTRDTAPPDACPPVAWDDLVEVRSASGRDVASGVHLCDAAWMRSRAPLPDDPVIHACGIVYLSDFGSGFAMQGREGVPPGGPSIDHAVWFHQAIRVDDWALLDLRPIRASDARGTYAGAVRDGRGRLGAVVGQEMLLRVRTRG